MNWPVLTVAIGSTVLILTMFMIFRRHRQLIDPDEWLLVALGAIVTIAIGAALI